MLDSADHSTDERARLRVKVFPGAQNLPLYAAIELGLFQRRGVDVELLFTVNSRELRDELASGEVDIVHTAVDNAVAMCEEGREVVVLMGGDSGMNELFVQPRFDSIESLRGQTLIVDAPDTAYALQARKILLDHGLRAETDYRVVPVGATFKREAAMAEDAGNAASILNPPFSIRSAARGLRSLGRVVDHLGPYQATAGFVMRARLDTLKPVLIRYIAGYIDAVRWCRAPSNRAACEAMLRTRLSIDEALAAQTCEVLMDEHFGIVPDARLDMEGFANVLAIRAELSGKPQATVVSPERYVDLECHEQALRMANSGLRAATGQAT